MKKTLLGFAVVATAALVAPATAQADNPGGDDFATVAPGQSVTVNVLANDFSDDAHPLLPETLVIIDPADGTGTQTPVTVPDGTFTPHTNGTITFTAKPDASGSASITYGSGTFTHQIVSATFTVTITRPSTAPTSASSSPVATSTSVAPTSSAPSHPSTSSTAPTSPLVSPTPPSASSSATVAPTSTSTSATSTGTPAPGTSSTVAPPASRSTGPVVQTDQTSQDNLPLEAGLAAAALVAAGGMTIAARRQR